MTDAMKSLFFDFRRSMNQTLDIAYHTLEGKQYHSKTLFIVSGRTFYGKDPCEVVRNHHHEAIICCCYLSKGNTDSNPKNLSLLHPPNLNKRRKIFYDMSSVVHLNNTAINLL